MRMKKENLMKTHAKNIPVRGAQLLGNTLVWKSLKFCGATGIDKFYLFAVGYDLVLCF